MVDAGEIKTTFQNGTTSYTATGSDVDFITYTDLRDRITVHIDTTNLVDPTVIKVKEEINGTSDLVKSVKTFPDDYDTDVTSIEAILDGGGEDMKITLSSVVASSVNIGTNTRKEIRL